MTDAPRACITCGKPIGPRGKTGYCRKHHNQSPESRAKRSEVMKRLWSTDPAYRDHMTTAGAANLRTETAVTRRAAAVKANRTWEKASAAITPEHRAKGALRNTETLLGHIPREYRDMYRVLTRNRRVPAAEAAAMIHEQHALDMARFRRKLEQGY